VYDPDPTSDLEIYPGPSASPVERPGPRLHAMGPLLVVVEMGIDRSVAGVVYNSNNDDRVRLGMLPCC
jgi:hypothetical protein